MKLNLNFSFVDLYSKAKQNISLVLLVVLGLLILMELWTVKGAWGVLATSQDSTLIVPPKLVRVNFNNYESIVKRIELSAVYEPQPFIQRNPFAVHEKDVTKKTVEQ